LRVGLDLRDHRLVDRVRQLGAHARHLVANIGGRGIGTARQLEAHVDLTALRPALRRHQFDAFDAGKRILEDLRHLRLDDFRRSAAVDGADAHHRFVDARILTHRQALIGDQSDQKDHQRQHRREHRPLDADFGQRHELTLCVAPA